MQTKKLSRRDFLRVSAVGGAGLVIAACAQATPPASTAAPGVPTSTAQAQGATQPPAATAAGAKSPRGFVEPPFLADRVASGKLPPIDQRLPDEVFVVGAGTLIDPQYGPWENGQYGGQIELAIAGGGGVINISNGSTIVRSPSQSTVPSKPNLISAFSNSADFTNWKFTIRKGLKWSDGQPFTTEDVRFPFEDMYADKDVNIGWPSELLTQANPALGPAAYKIVDDLNFELTFSQPYGLFIAALNSWIPGYDIMFKPAHYLKQFHAKYADKAALAALLQKANETSWVKLLTSKATSHWDAGEIRTLGLPRLDAWTLTVATDTVRKFERNPFFHHVDSNGLQLPYIDTIVNNLTVDDKASLAAVMAGKVTVVAANTIALSDMPVIVGNAAKFHKKVFTTGSFNYPIQLFFNHDFEYDKAGSVWQTLITDPAHRFGQAIAFAMDPNEVNTSVFFGKYGKPFGNATGPDLAKANSLLDALGMDKKGSDGLRLGPDGKPFIMRITHYTQAPEIPAIAELLKAQIQKSGVHVEIEVVDGTLWGQRVTANQISNSLHWNDGPAWSDGISEDFLPRHKGPWSPLTYAYFISNGKEGRKPPAYIQTFYDLYTTRKQYTPKSDKGIAIFQQLLHWMWDNYAMIPTVGLQTKPASVDDNLKNVPIDGSLIDLDVYINDEGYWFAKA